ncbi:MAG: hypothetical protein Q8L98_03880 [Chlamydiales bacterium]|nr:hypothetical protein [Chlamydiales bacterium]
MSYRLAARHNLQDLRRHRLIDFNQFLSDKPGEAHFLWGERIVTWSYLDFPCQYSKLPGPQAKNYFSLNTLASEILTISHNPDGLSLRERAAGIQIVEKTLSLYEHTDNKLPFKGLITRILAAIREGSWLSFLLPIVDQTRLQLKITAEGKFASFEELDFRKEFNVPKDMRLEDHPAFSDRIFGDQIRIIAKTDAILAKVEESKQLINTLLEGEDFQDPYIKDLTSGNAFAQDPTKVMIFGMIHRGVHIAMEHDSTRARIMGRIPGFIEQATSIEYLRELSRQYCLCKVTGRRDWQKFYFFQKSLKHPTFLQQLEKAKTHFEQGEFYYADEALRAAYQIFPCADNFEEYHVPELILESAAVRQ